MCCMNAPQHGGYVWNDNGLKSHVTTALIAATKWERGTGRHKEGAMLGSPHTVACNAILRVGGGGAAPLVLLARPFLRV